ncbi:hydantoinase B/oxoprolinase family protein [Chryseolinea sp. Jin1]|uniref:Hydantoinase B/oxoprolinase family protein n=1 Tax=Chryseolinea lacunae TaxID=2801331 RepID=A0ABS1KRP7_9BACT|nr:hydantoinase B/oxoprolinase family protein [Chryseolinea lacunae]MBL0741868.1 hydantoinase B/oxoprolinase family protein [Chryseolinea lacunae]
MSHNTPAWKIWVDTGGTFTDCISLSPQGDWIRLKVLSSGLLRVRAQRAGDALLTVRLPIAASPDFLKGFQVRWASKSKTQRGKSSVESATILRYDETLQQIAFDKSLPKSFDSDTIDIFTGEEVPVFAARWITQTSLSQSFPPLEMKLGSTRGTNALLERKGAKMALLVTKGFKDLLRIGNQQRKDLFALNVVKDLPLYADVLEVDERIAAEGTILLAPHLSGMEEIVLRLRKKKIESVAVAFLNSYKNPEHELQVGKALRDGGFAYVSLSSQLSSQIKILPRAETATVNAYLDPIIRRYIGNIQSVLVSADLKVMSSAGGLLEASDFKPKDSLLSGPAGGVMGALTKAQQSGIEKILTFDMGGTSTDVSRCDGRPDYRFEATVGDLKILSPSLAIETIAAGGGSVCDYDGFRFTVGPHSAGASPGPACYGAGGPLTITDVNALLGRLDDESFSIPLRLDAARDALTKVIGRMKPKKGTVPKRDDVLQSFIDIANEKMADAIRKVSLRNGHDPRDYALLSFGGAGGQHACALASMLNIQHVVVPYDAGLLSAYGIGHARLESVKEKLVLTKLADVAQQLTTWFDVLFDEAKEALSRNFKNGVPHIDQHRLIFLRLKGQETSLEVTFTDVQTLTKNFIVQYKKVYGHWLGDRDIEVESLRVVVTAGEIEQVPDPIKPKTYAPVVTRRKSMFVAGQWKNCAVFQWETLSPGARIEGPALVSSLNSTLVLEEGWRFDLDEKQNAHVRHVRVAKTKTVASAEALLELFTNRFTSVAQEMGTLLQRTSFSVNVKERLDFSCAVLDASGSLVVNAPHIPVHLGSMGVCVRSVMNVVDMRDGDVIITNHPAFGGSHLPDITLIKPVFYRKQRLGFVTNRAHHAEIGGKKPGSMPADARCLEEEGVVIAPTYLVKRGVPQWEHIEKLLTSAPYPTRALQENLADLNGALAALLLGAESLQNYCTQFGLDDVRTYMTLLKQHAALLMQQKIKSLPVTPFKAEEFLDDGARLSVSLYKKKNTLHVDFTGTADVRPGNLNATVAIMNSVVLYVLRLWVNEAVPLNEGLLRNVKLILPRSLLNPKFFDDNKKSPAVVGGNTEVSQRLTDTLLKALRLSACSQGTMNNFLFGNERFGYYETICGGVGAGQGFHGADAVHQHMTNTRITDPEILEFRYPVRLLRFEIRRSSGGAGKWKGGDGIVREFYFNEALDINMLSQHRVSAPYGMKGGGPGKTGEQFIIKHSGKIEKLRGVDGTRVSPGDRLVIKTPGGGGWGR